MVDCYVGEVRLFAGPKVPNGWHLCDGTLLSINDYSTLYSLLGTVYGGDGRVTFGIPDLRGRVPVGQGQGTGLTSRGIGEIDGVESVVLAEANLPPHTHLIQTAGAAATTATPGPGVTLANAAAPFVQYHSNAAAAAQNQVLNALSIKSSGSGGAHANVMPTAVLTYIIALVGLYPSRP